MRACVARVGSNEYIFALPAVSQVEPLTMYRTFVLRTRTAVAD